jgi:drug/metabolite transporter superfamily protein YnfA
MKLTPDIINGTFEIIGGMLCCLNVRQIWRDRKVTGFYWPTQAFFAIWGMWNLYFYPTLGQWFSFGGGVFLVLANTTWTLLAHHYSKKERLQAAIQI